MTSVKVTKVCNKCWAEKELTEYYKTYGGYRNTCKDCKIKLQIEYNKNNKDVIKDHSRKYYAMNKDELNRNNRSYYQSNREDILKQKHEYYIKMKSKKVQEDQVEN